MAQVAAQRGVNAQVGNCADRSARMLLLLTVAPPGERSRVKTNIGWLRS